MKQVDFARVIRYEVSLGVVACVRMSYFECPSLNRSLMICHERRQGDLAQLYSNHVVFK